MTIGPHGNIGFSSDCFTMGRSSNHILLPLFFLFSLLVSELVISVRVSLLFVKI